MAPRKWTRQIVIERIQSLHQQGIPVGQIGQVDPKVRKHGYLLFGNWPKALKKAGFETARKVWSEQRVLDALQAEYTSNLSRSRRNQQRDPRLATVAHRLFGSRHAAFVAAGIIPKYPLRVKRSWTSAEVIAAILARHEQGLPLVNIKKYNSALFTIARKTFGGWNKALVAAGLACEKPQPLSREEIIHNLQSRYQRGESLVNLARTEVRLYRQLAKRFGSLHNALTAVGLPSQPRRRWTKKSIVDALKNRHINGPGFSNVWKDDQSLIEAAVKHFGTWQSALDAAGIKIRSRNKWSIDRILEALRQTYRGQLLNDVDPCLLNAAQRYFGGFYVAVEAAGLDLPCRKWSRQKIIQLIQEYYVKGHLLEIIGFGDKLLAAVAKRYFGTWLEAVKVAGLESRMPAQINMRSWSADKVLIAIRSMAESDRKLSGAWKDNGLYSAAKKHFGTWRKAVLAAGIEPAQRRWSQDLVIHEIQEQYRRNQQLTRRVGGMDSPLAVAAVRYFGSWRAALVAAGIPEEKLPQRSSTCGRSNPTLW